MSNPPTAADRRFANAAIDQQIDNARQSPTRRNVTVHVLDTLTEARTLIGSLLPTDEAIFTVSSQTLVVSGIGANIDVSGRLRSVRSTSLAGLDPRSADARRIAASPDMVVGSATLSPKTGRSSSPQPAAVNSAPTPRQQAMSSTSSERKKW